MRRSATTSAGRPDPREELIEGLETRDDREDLGRLGSREALAQVALGVEPPDEVHHPGSPPVLDRAHRGHAIGVDGGEREQAARELGHACVHPHGCALGRAHRVERVRQAERCDQLIEARLVAKVAAERVEEAAPRPVEEIHGRTGDAGLARDLVDLEGAERPAFQRSPGGVEDPLPGRLGGCGASALHVSTFVHG